MQFLHFFFPFLLTQPHFPHLMETYCPHYSHVPNPSPPFHASNIMTYCSKWQCMIIEEKLNSANMTSMYSTQMLDEFQSIAKFSCTQKPWKLSFQFKMLNIHVHVTATTWIQLFLDTPTNLQYNLPTGIHLQLVSNKNDLTLTNSCIPCHRSVQFLY